MSKHVLSAIFLMYSALSFADHGDLLVGWELWYPYQYHNKQGQLVGLDIDSFNAIAKHAGVKTHFIETPWKRHLHLVKHGRIDIAFGASYSEEREEYAYFTKPYRYEKVNLFVKKGSKNKIKLATLSDLKTSPYMIGVEGGYFYGNNYQELIKDLDFQDNINEVVDIEQNVTMLLDGHIDGFLVDPLTMRAFIQKYKMVDEFEVHDLEIYQDTIHIMLSKKSMSKEMLVSFNKAIDELTASGELEKIINNWKENIK